MMVTNCRHNKQNIVSEVMFIFFFQQALQSLLRMRMITIQSSGVHFTAVQLLKTVKMV